MGMTLFDRVKSWATDHRFYAGIGVGVAGLWVLRSLLS